MGKYPRRKQKRLGEKLLQIREALKLSQNEMLWHLGLSEYYSRTIVSNYEQDHREPPLFPKKMPATPKHRGVKISAGRVRTAKKISSRRPLS